LLILTAFLQNYVIYIIIPYIPHTTNIKIMLILAILIVIEVVEYVFSLRIANINDVIFGFFGSLIGMSMNPDKLQSASASSK